jgi:hypothetical protein
MKKIAFLLFVIALCTASLGCQYLNVPSFRLYVGYDVNPKSEIIPNDYALPKPRTEK